MDLKDPNAAITPKFKIVAIDLFKVQLDTDITPSSNEDLANNKFGFKINFQGGADANLRCIIVTLNADTHLMSEPSKILGSISVRYFFEIENYEEVVTLKEDGTDFIEKRWVHLFNNIATSTTRGVMFGLFKGTLLHGAILPIIDITKAEFSTI